MYNKQKERTKQKKEAEHLIIDNYYFVATVD